MAINLADAYKRSGLAASPEHDALLTSVVNACIATIENYLDRFILFNASEDQFFYTHHQDYALQRYPIENISSIEVDGKPLGVRYKVHQQTGIVKLDHHMFAREIKFSYSGGYRVLPADLELAFWVLFQEYLGISQGGASSVAAGAIESITVQDVGTIRFNTGNNASQGAISSTSGLPDSVISLINPYRRYSV